MSAASETSTGGVPRRPLLAALAGLLAAGLVGYGAWAWIGRPVPLVDAPTERLRCVSYAPFNQDQSPFQEGLVVPPAQIRTDLQALSRMTSCVRTYAVDQGLEAVPAIARELGLKVLLGAWIGRDPVGNEKQIAGLIRLANEHPDTVRAVIVGNEVLLRREQPPHGLAELLQRVKAAVPVEVTYADVWEFWEKHAALADHVDFVTVHILPFWEDHPIAIRHAVSHVSDIVDIVRRIFAGKRILIGETGWPSAGRMREGAAPGRVNQARFFREFMAMAERRQLDYNLIEAFDQPWKRHLEGTVGGQWGLFDTHRAAKFPLLGPVSEEPHWRWIWGAGLAGSLALLGGALALRLRLDLARALATGLAGQVLGALVALQIKQIRIAAVEPFDVAMAVAGIAATAAAACCALLAAGRAPHERRAAVVPFVGVLALLARRATRRDALGLAIAALRLCVMVAAASTALALAIDPRYRDFPTAVYLGPAIAFLALRAMGALATPGDGREERGLAALVLALAAIGLAREGLANQEALGWCATLALLALADLPLRFSAWRRRAAPG
ncbi:MAG: hypothetical protein JNK11_05675 [Alphaproteobacteria bacterium]|nr:hypothetical protein [Alphaproteobacteria bacterium]